MSLFSGFLIPPDRIDRYESDDLVVSTCGVPDGSHDYETAVSHPDYNDGSYIIVEAYDDENDARKGHDKWVKTMTAEQLPAALNDCCNAYIGQLAASMGGDMTHKRKPK